MITFWRRVRGIIGTASVWFVSWAALGALYMFTDVLLHYWNVPEVRAGMARGLIGFGAFWGIWGAFSGILYALAVAVTQRGRALSELLPGRLALWGAAAGAAYPGLQVAASILSGNPGLADGPLAIGLGAVAGGASAAGSLWIVRRAEALSLARAAPLPSDGDEESHRKLLHHPESLEY